MLFLKGKYYLLESGKVLRRPCKASALRVRRKLRKFKPLVEAGKMSYADIRTACQSWRGSYMKRFNAYHSVRSADALYNTLFIIVEVLYSGLEAPNPNFAGVCQYFFAVMLSVMGVEE
ncbi:MAG: hypothetical protein LBD13_08195 [Spirochaetaceae bacterium]|jgi:hypothetical protein|nr:hypothetical protein [Spirochaetaceae bacterium]